MIPETYVLDATLFRPEEPTALCFCPCALGDDGEITSVYFGLSYIAHSPPGKFVGVVHMDGQEAVDKFMEENAEHVAHLFS